MEFWGLLGFGFLLGVKHATEPDHVIAVSTIAAESRSLRRASLAGVYWGFGHTLTLLVVGTVLLAVRGQVPEKWSLSLEFLVGVMLVALGINALNFRTRRVHSHVHWHGGLRHTHFHEHPDGRADDHRHRHTELSYVKAGLVGVVHGLAGSAAMALLAASTAKTVWLGMLYIVVFGAGTVLGMGVCTAAVGLPFALTANRRASLNRALGTAAGALSVVYGAYYMYHLGVSEGLFRLWLEA